MPNLTTDQLTALARSGATNRGIEATLGRAMTANERAAVDRARVVAQNLGRKVYGLEIAPNYCAVILQRMCDAFPGIEIRREEGGAA